MGVSLPITTKSRLNRLNLLIRKQTPIFGIMRFIIPLFICLSLLSCKKEDDAKVDGFYAVTFDDNLGEKIQGEILIEGYRMTFDAMPYWKREVNANITGLNIVYNNSSPYISGSATVNDNRISGYIRIQANSGLKQYGFEGYK